jgi:hypothetical protein
MVHNYLINYKFAFFHSMTGATTISMGYGIKVEEENDPHVKLSEYTLTRLSQAILPGNFLVDTFYWLRHIPEGFPGTGWKAKVRAMRHEMQEFRDKPYQAALEAIVSGRYLRQVIR